MIVKNIEIKRRAKTVLGSMPDIDTDFPGRRRDEIKATWKNGSARSRFVRLALILPSN